MSECLEPGTTHNLPQPDARAALRAAKQKLELYRAQHSGEYIGGMEYTALIALIDEALR